MNRRNLLRGAGSLALGLPALSASRLMASPLLETSSSVKDLIVTFTGPFCFWLEKNSMRIMAPPVGTDSLAQHRGWIGTSTNETVLNSKSTSSPPVYALTGVPQQSALPTPSGTPLFNYEQGTPLGRNPLFNFNAPFPQSMAGARPTDVNITETENHGPQMLGAAINFYYKSVNLADVWVTMNGENFFQPCFTNDNDLPCAILGIHLTPLNQFPDHHHVRAKYVWRRMRSMYPWMDKDVHGITFLKFDTASCPPPDAKAANSAGAEDSVGNLGNGPGHVCEVPVMMLTSQGKGGQKH
jgi:hypothetical protein